MIHHLVVALSLVSAASAAVIDVTVGSGGLVYNPNSITGAVGDVVRFRFTGAPGNHTVSQAAFSAPCAQLDGGFDSGYVPVPSGFSGTPAEWNLTITDASKPIWFYCKQKSPAPHCIAGMVGAINSPSSGNTLDNFVAAAKALGSLPTQTAGSLTGAGASASAAPSPLAGGSSTPASSAVSSAASATPTSPNSSGSSAPSASATTKPNGAFKTASMASTGLWTLLAGVLGIVVA